MLCTFESLAMLIVLPRNFQFSAYELQGTCSGMVWGKRYQRLQKLRARPAKIAHKVPKF